MSFFKHAVQKIDWPVLLFILCLSVGAFLRLWNFPNSLQFLGDQGRDAIIAKRILIDHNFVLIGPVTSTGNMYLGPLYYYFMVPFLALSYPSPIGPAYAIAGLSILTIWLMYYLGKEVVGKQAALVATILATFAQTFVYFARFSWNPNPSPLISLLLIWATFRAVTKKPHYWILVAVLLAVLVQLHYITLLCIPAAGFIWLVQLRKHILSLQLKSNQETQNQIKTFLLFTLSAVFVFLISFAPLAVFDVRHQFVNSQSFTHFITADLGPNQSTLIDKVRLIVTRTFLRANQTVFQEFVWSNVLVSSIFIGALSVGLAGFWKQQKKELVGVGILLVYLILSILGLGYYRGAIFNHYFVFLIPMSMLLWGVALEYFSHSKIGLFICVVFSVLFFSWNISHYRFTNSSWSIEQIEQVGKTITSRLSPNEKYNIILLSDSGDIEGQNYRYFLEVSAHPPLRQEDWGQVDTLFIINEDHKLKRVVDSPIYEIVVFPNKQPVEVYTIPDGPEITVLRR